MNWLAQLVSDIRFALTERPILRYRKWKESQKK